MLKKIIVKIFILLIFFNIIWQPSVHAFGTWYCNKSVKNIDKLNFKQNTIYLANTTDTSMIDPPTDREYLERHDRSEYLMAEIGKMFGQNYAEQPYTAEDILNAYDNKSELVINNVTIQFKEVKDDNVIINAGGENKAIKLDQKVEEDVAKEEIKTALGISEFGKPTTIYISIFSHVKLVKNKIVGLNLPEKGKGAVGMILSAKKDTAQESSSKVSGTTTEENGIIDGIKEDLKNTLIKQILNLFISIGDAITTALNQLVTVSDSFKVMYNPSEISGNVQEQMDYVAYGTKDTKDYGDAVKYTIPIITEDEDGEKTQFEPDSFRVPYIPFSIESIILGQGLFNVNFLSNDTVNDNTGIWKIIKDFVMQILRGLLGLTLAFLLVGLVYKAIKVIINTLKDEPSWKNAKDQEILTDWIASFIKLLMIVFLMAIIMALIEGLINELYGKSQFGIRVSVEDLCSYNSNFIGIIRTRAQSLSIMDKTFYTVLYFVVIAITLRFTWVYIKRMLTMAFLTIVAPISICIDVIKKNRQDKPAVKGKDVFSFQGWTKAYISTALLQIMHFILYYMFVKLALDQGIIFLAVLVLAIISVSDKLIGLVTQKTIGVNPSTMLPTMMSAFSNKAKVQTAGALKASHELIDGIKNKAEHSIAFAGLGMAAGSISRRLTNANLGRNIKVDLDEKKYRKEGFEARNKEDGKVHRLVSREVSLRKTSKGKYANKMIRFMAPKAARIKAMINAKNNKNNPIEIVRVGSKASKDKRQQIDNQDLEKLYQEFAKKYGVEAAQGIIRRKEASENQELLNEIEKRYSNKRISSKEEFQIITEKTKDAFDMHERIAGLTVEQTMRALEMATPIKEKIAKEKDEKRLQDYKGIDAKEETEKILNQMLKDGSEEEVLEKQEKFDKIFNLQNKAEEEFNKVDRDEKLIEKAQKDAEKEFNKANKNTGKKWQDLSQDLKNINAKRKLQEILRESKIRELAQTEEFEVFNRVDEIFGKEKAKEFRNKVEKVIVKENQAKNLHIERKIEIEAKRMFNQMPQERKEEFITKDGLQDVEKLVKAYKENEERQMQNKSNVLAAQAVQLSDKLPQSRKEQKKILANYTSEDSKQAVKLAIAANEIKKGREPKDAIAQINLL